MKKDSTKSKKNQNNVETKTALTVISNRKLAVLGVALICIVLAISLTVPKLLTKNNDKTAEASKVIANLEKILLLPEDSDPTVIEVSDVERLKRTNPEFYKDAQKGDFLLMYSEKAVIYRKANNQVINVAPIVSKDTKEIAH